MVWSALLEFVPLLFKLKRYCFPVSSDGANSLKAHSLLLFVSMMTTCFRACRVPSSGVPSLQVAPDKCQNVLPVLPAFGLSWAPLLPRRASGLQLSSRVGHHRKCADVNVGIVSQVAFSYWASTLGLISDKTMSAFTM